MDHSDATLPVVPSPQDDNTSDLQLVGRTDKLIFWGVMLAASLVVTFMLNMISSGAIALAATTPIPFTIQATKLTGTNFRLYPGLSSADKTTPVAVNQFDCQITDLVISKTLQVPVIGAVTVKLSAGSNTPASLGGLTTDVSALTSSSATFQNLSLTSGGNGFDQQATDATLNTVSIDSPYLVVNSITLPGLAISITH